MKRRHSSHMAPLGLHVVTGVVDLRRLQMGYRLTNALSSDRA